MNTKNTNWVNEFQKNYNLSKEITLREEIKDFIKGYEHFKEQESKMLNPLNDRAYDIMKGVIHYLDQYEK